MPRRQRNQDLRNTDDAELETRLTEAKQELFNLRFQNVTGQLDNTSRIPHVKRDIARIHTVLREREIEAAERAEAEARAQTQEAAR